ncbi:hypothetical protein CVT26_002819, partial [Gymnopilus dilepis]
LPNRLPLTHLPAFLSKLPLLSLELIEPHIPGILQQTGIEAKVHLAATLYMFMSPHYKKLSAPAFAAYLRLSIGLIGAFPRELFKEKARAAKGAKTKSGKSTPSRSTPNGAAYDSDPEPRVMVVSHFSQPTTPAPLPQIDDKTLTRLSKLVSAAHLTPLISATQAKASLFPELIRYLFTLTLVWPEDKQGEILNVILASAGQGGGLVREVYRVLVRRSGLGKEGQGGVMDPANFSQYPPLLFLSDLYSQALLTMGDDEFFGTAPSGPQTRAPRNPLSLDELVEFSKQLLNIAFTLYWRDGQGTGHGEGNYVSDELRCSWDVVREKVTRCLVGIHARDSRRPFVPPDHWLITSQLDMQSFVEAAILEEQQLSQDQDEAPSPPPSTHPIHHHHRSHHPRHTLSKRQIASLSPRLGILNNIPFCIPFEVRVSIFRHFVLNDMMKHASETDRGGMGALRRSGFGYGLRPRVQVRRGMVAQDGFDKLAEADLKAPFGEEELVLGTLCADVILFRAGIDGGGVFKEFFTSLCKEVFDTDRGLWLATKNNELYPNPHAYATEPHSLNWYRFIGRILGKAMYEGILVDVAFAGFFLAKWLGRQNFLDDLASLDPELYNGLIFLKHYTGNVEDLSLNFTISIEEFGVTKTVDLIKNGSNIAVTKENRLQYIYLVSHYRLTKQIKLQSEAFFEGLSEMIDPKWLRMFNRQEVQVLIGGVNSPIDMDDLRQHTNYGGLYDDNHETIEMFWRVVNSFNQEQRRALLRFVTSCSRPPLLGFKELVPNFSIRDAGSDQYRLPTSSTCVNLLKLPRYTNEKTLRDKLLQAINSNAGFDLS